MAHATTFSAPFVPSFAGRADRALGERPNVWQRFLDALDSLGVNTPPSTAAHAFAHAYRTQALPQER